METMDAKLTKEDKEILSNVLIEAILEARSLAKQDKESSSELYAESVKIAQATTKLVIANILDDKILDKLDQLLRN